jgi:antitoxin component of MazEF toxin-antitoxin module
VQEEEGQDEQAAPLTMTDPDEAFEEIWNESQDGNTATRTLY